MDHSIHLSVDHGANKHDILTNSKLACALANFLEISTAEAMGDLGLQAQQLNGNITGK